MPRKSAISVAEWKSLVAEYEAGDETQAAFCKRKGISLSSLQFYRSNRSPLSATPPSPKFKELTLPLPTAQSEYEIRLAKGTIVIKGSIVASEIKELLLILEG